MSYRGNTVLLRNPALKFLFERVRRYSNGKLEVIDAEMESGSNGSED